MSTAVKAAAEAIRRRLRPETAPETREEIARSAVVGFLRARAAEVDRRSALDAVGLKASQDGCIPASDWLRREADRISQEAPPRDV